MMRNPAEQLLAVRDFAKALGFEATGQHERRPNARYFEVQDSGGETAWTTLRHLQDGKNPFNQKKTIEEQLALASAAAKQSGLKITGQYRQQGNHKIFEVISPSGRSVYMNLYAITHGDIPRPSIDEQLEKAREYASRIDLTATGQTQRKPNGVMYFEVSNGVEQRFISLAHLKSGRNPFNASFKLNKKAYLYLFSVKHLGRRYLKLGITNNFTRRQEDHLMTCRKIGAELNLLQVAQMPGQQALEKELLFKRMIKNKTSLDATGFKTESAPYHPALLKRLTESFFSK